MPGRPSVEKFVVEYREGNHSSTWFRADDNVPAERKDYLFSAELAEADKWYDFRVSSCDATTCSEPAYVTVRYNIGELLQCLVRNYVVYLIARQRTFLTRLSFLLPGSPVFDAHSGGSNIYIIVGGVLGTICAVLLIALLCFFCCRKRKRDSKCLTYMSNAAAL